MNFSRLFYPVATVFRCLKIKVLSRLGLRQENSLKPKWSWELRAVSEADAPKELGCTATLLDVQALGNGAGDLPN